ncbi:MAG: hypothetical protein AAF199_07605, partial [Pseudomonadota bacterium]
DYNRRLWVLTSILHPGTRALHEKQWMTFRSRARKTDVCITAGGDFHPAPKIYVWFSPASNIGPNALLRNMAAATGPLGA